MKKLYFCVFFILYRLTSVSAQVPVGFEFLYHSAQSRN